MSEQDKEWLAERAIAWLEQNAGPRPLAEPPEPELRAMMDMVTGGTMGDLEFEARRDLTGFKPYPYMAQWTNGKPDLPPGFRVAIIGSGFAGIGTGVQFEQLGIPYTVFERRAEPGGVWSINRYPDVRVDTISVTYEYLFEKDFRWSEYFGRGPQVRDYLRHVAAKHGVLERTRFDHDLKTAAWDEARSVWVLEFETQEGRHVEEFNVVISAAGLFANPKPLEVEGRDSFDGEIVHTAQWRDDIELDGKRVGVVGNGSTGVQILKAVAGAARHVTVFQRTPQWIMPRERYGQALDPEVAWLLDNLPGYANWWRYSATSDLFETHSLMQPDPDWQAKGGLVNAGNDAIRAQLISYIHEQTGGRQDLIDKLTPDYAPFSRRPIVDNGWYRALTRNNVDLVTSPVVRLVPEGVETRDGIRHEVDLLVTATGYDVVKYLWPARYVGRNNVDLHQRWDEGDGPRAYIGMLHPGFPNLFTLYGPNSQPISGGPAQPVWFAIWAAYAAQCIIRMLETGHNRVEVRAEAYERYNLELDAEASKLIQMSKEGGVDKNYYVNADHRRLQVNAPFYSPYYHRLCSRVAWSDLQFGGAQSGENETGA